MLANATLCGSTPAELKTQRSRLQRIGIPLVAALCALQIAAAAAETLNGRVIGIADGDTITVLDEANQAYKIRLQGIDAPEKKQAYGNVSRQHLAQLVFQRSVQVDYTKSDRYGRLVGTVLLAGEDVNLRQIQTGLAWHFKKYAGEQSQDERERYSAAELAARSARLGLWREAAPIAPWQFREERRSTSR